MTNNIEKIDQKFIETFINDVCTKELVSFPELSLHQWRVLAYKLAEEAYIASLPEAVRLTDPRVWVRNRSKGDNE